MSRTPRKKSSSGLYHVMLRGINQQIIFEDEQDYHYFLRCIRHAQEDYPFELYTYCLMNNHIHLLINVGNSPLDLIIKSISCKYVYYFNHKYNRIGHLFQDRFRSEIITDSAYLLHVCRYILQNPIKAGITTHISQYIWTNYKSFLGYKDTLTNISNLKCYFQDTASFLTYLNAPSPEDCMDYSPTHYKYISDPDARRYLEEVTNCKNATEFQLLEKEDRNLFLHQLKEMGLSVRQLNRLTGISKTVIGRA